MTAEPASATGPRVDGPAGRPEVLLPGGGGAVLALLLGLACLAGPVVLAVAVLALQVLLVRSALALLDAPAPGATSLLAGVAALVGDLLVLRAGGRAGALAGVVALAFIASLLHQLSRPDRTRVTEALADTLLVVVLATCAACLPALRGLDGGRDVALAALAAGGSALLAGRLGDRFLPRPALTTGTQRGWPGLLLGLGAGVAAASAVAAAGGAAPLPGARAALVGLAAAAVVAAADLAVDAASTELRAGARDARRVAALRPVGLLLPVAVLAPVALVAGLLVLP